MRVSVSVTKVVREEQCRVQSLTLKTLCRPSGVGSLARTLFRSSCSAASVFLYRACVVSNVDQWNISRVSLFVFIAMQLYRHKVAFGLHLPLLGIQHLLIFSFFWSVCVGWQGDHAVHTHFEQVKAFVLTQRRLQWPDEEPVKEKMQGRCVWKYKICRIFLQHGTVLCFALTVALTIIVYSAA